MPAAEHVPTPGQRAALIDCHVHLAALPDGNNGCYISPRMLHSPLFRFLLWKHELPRDDPATANRRYVEDLLAELRKSRHVGRAVLLGMDGVYDANGILNQAHTDFLIGNDYVLETARTYPQHFLPGVSINPQRRDAIDELQRCASAGATLVKVLPNAQAFDPSDRRYIPFYREMARLKIPLLSHVGYEFSLIGKDQSGGDPDKLRVPLDEGVTVIAAHGCSYGLMIYERFYRSFLDLVNRYPQFYSDISALTLPNRFGMLLRLRHHPEVHDRLLYGTDYPLGIYQIACWGRVWRGLIKLMRADNRFDKNVEVFKRLGVGFSSLEKALSRS